MKKKILIFILLLEIPFSLQAFPFFWNKRRVLGGTGVVTTAVVYDTDSNVPEWDTDSNVIIVSSDS